MHLFPYHIKTKWKQLLLGIFIGSTISYIIIAWMHGQMYEKLLLEKVQLEANFIELEKKHTALLEDKAALENTAAKIETIDISWLNEEDFKMDRLIKHQLEKLVKDELNAFIGKKVSSVAENETILINLIEKQTYTIDEISYEFEIRKLFLTENIHLHIFIKKVN